MAGTSVADTVALCTSCGRERRCPGSDTCTFCLPVSLGVTYRQLDHWCRLGYLHPEFSGGSGRNREWPAAELEVARRMGQLTAAGIAVAVAHDYARNRWPDGEIAPGIWLSAFGEAEAVS